MRATPRRSGASLSRLTSAICVSRCASRPVALAFGLCPALVRPSSRLADPSSPSPTGSAATAPDRRGTHAQGDRTHPPSAPNVSVTVEQLLTPTAPYSSPRIASATCSKSRRSRSRRRLLHLRRTHHHPRQTEETRGGNVVSPRTSATSAVRIRHSLLGGCSRAALRRGEVRVPRLRQGVRAVSALVFHVKSHKREAMSHQQAMDAAVRSMHNTTAQATDSPATKKRPIRCPSPACEHNPEVDRARIPSRTSPTAGNITFAATRTKNRSSVPNAIARTLSSRTCRRREAVRDAVPCSCGAWFNLARTCART